MIFDKKLPEVATFRRYFFAASGIRNAVFDCVAFNIGVGMIRIASRAMKKKQKAMMLGVGLDSDGSKRITKGSNFSIVGGSKETHEIMTEKVIKINEKLNAKGRDLESVSRAEFDDIAHEVGLKRHAPHLN